MTSRLKRAILSVLVLALPFLSSSQDKKTTFGIQLRPIVNSDIAGSGPFSVINDDLVLDVKPLTGFAFGMIIRADLTKSITLETGINRAGRRFRYDLFDTARDVRRTTEFSFINYELPIKGLIYTQLGKKTFLNAALGVSIDMYASDVSSGQLNFRQETFRKQWAQLAMEANLGVEYRTKKNGYFYFGSTYHNPFSDAARSLIRYEGTMGIEERFAAELNAGYLTLDFRYFFHEEAE